MVVKDTSLFEINKYNGPHKCVNPCLNWDHQQLDSNLVAGAYIQGMINAQFTLLVVSIQASVVEKFVLGVDPVFFTMRSHLMTRLTFNLFSENMIFRKDLESPLIFVLFLRENKIRKKTLSVTL